MSRVRNVAVPTVVGLVVGVAVARAVALVGLESSMLSFWPLVFGVPAGLASAALALGVLGRGRRAGRAGLYWLSAVLGLFGAAAVWWNALFAGPPTFSADGVVWLLAMVPLLGAVVAWQAARRTSSASGSSHGG